MQHITTFAEAEQALEPFWYSRLKRYAYTTEHMQAFMEFLGAPQDWAPAIHIAGTSGKTSTAYYAAALLKAAGMRAGLLISPHLESLNERVQIDLTPLEEKRFCEDLAGFLELVEKSAIQLTYAEILYAYAYWQFARERVDCMVVETGMGGLLDATNVMTRRDKVCIITDISLDHTNVLGNRLQDIAQHKTGIIQLHNAVFCHAQVGEVVDEIKRASRQKQADLHVIDEVSVSPDLAFLPLFQQRNFALALEAVRFILARTDKEPLSAEAVLTAAQTHIPARMEVLQYKDKTIVLDGAHNPQKLTALRKSLDARFPGQPVAVLAAFTQGRGRRLETLLDELAPITRYVIAASPVDDPHLWHAPEEIMRACKQTAIPLCQLAPDYRQAFQALLERPEPVLLVTGSLYIHQYIRPLALSRVRKKAYNDPKSL